MDNHYRENLHHSNKPVTFTGVHEHRKSSAVITGQISGSIFQEDSKPHWHQQHLWQQTTNIRKNKKEYKQEE